MGAPLPDPAAPVDYISWYNNSDNGKRNDAFDTYLEAYEQLTAFTGEWGLTLVEPWSDNEVVASWLQANQVGLASFRRAAVRNDFFVRLNESTEFVEPRLQSLFFAWEKPAWVDHLNASRGLIAEGWLAWQAGDEERLLENAMLALRAAHHLQGTDWPISRLVGDGTARPAYTALRYALARSRDPTAWAAGLSTLLERNDPPAPPFGHACSLLRVEFWDLSQRIFLAGGADGKWPVHAGAIQALASRLEDEPETLTQQLESIGMATSLRESDAYYDALERWNSLPFHLAAREPFPLDQLLNSSDNPLHRLQARLTAQTRALVERTIAERRATHLIVHLMLHKAHSGSYPVELGQLAASDLATLRRDPFSGEDFDYRRTGDDFVLYSVAFNMVDDGGRHDPEWNSGDFVFWPVPRGGQ